MAFTQNINQASLQSTLQTDAQQSADAMQSKQIDATASENQKSRDHDDEQKNIAAGDKWKENHPDEELSEAQVSEMGSDVLNQYSFAQDELILGGEEMSTKNYSDRVRGQDRKLRANKIIKNLAGEYMEVEEGIGDVVTDGNILPSESLDVLKEMSIAKANGKFDVVSANTAGEKSDTERYIRWENEKGETQYKSVKWTKSAYENQATRFDTVGWVGGIKDNLKASRQTNPDGTFEDQVAGGDTVDGYVDEVMNQPETVAALRQQFATEEDEVIRTRLTELLGGAVGLDRSRQTTASKTKVPATKVKDQDRESALQHRRYEVSQGTGEQSLDFLTSRLQGKSAKYGVGKDQRVESVSLEDNKIILTFPDGENRSVEHNNSNVNDLFNQFTYNLDEQKFLWANVADREPKNAAENVKEPSKTEVVEDKALKGVQQAFNVATDKAGKIDIKHLQAEMKRKFPELLSGDGSFNIQQWYQSGQVSLFGQPYKLKTKEEQEVFQKAISDKLSGMMNKKKDNKSEGKKTYQGLDENNNAIYK